MNLLNITHFRRAIAVTTLLFSLGTFAFPFHANAQTAPNGITIQGELKNSSGVAHSNLDLDFRVSLWGDADYDASTDNAAGNLVGSGHTAAILPNITTDSNGFFFFNLTDLPASFDATSHRYVQIEARLASSNSLTDFKVLDYIASNPLVDRKDAAMMGAFAQTANFATTAGDANTVGGLDLATYYREPVADAAALAAVTDMVAGTVIYQTDTAEVKFYDGSTWVTLGADTAADLTALTNRVTVAETEIDTLQTQMTTAQTNITNAQNAANTAASDAAAAQADADANAAAIASNDTDIAANTAAAAAAQADADANAAAIASNDTDIAALQSSMTTAQSDIASLQSAVSGLTWLSPVSSFGDIATTYASPSEGDVVAVTGEGTAYIYTIAGGWEALVQDFVIASATTTQAGIVELAADGEVTAGLAVQANDSRLAQIATNTSSINNNSIDITTANTNISTNATNIATNATDIAGNTTDIATNATNISSNTTAISAIQEGTTFDQYAMDF